MSVQSYPFPLPLQGNTKPEMMVSEGHYRFSILTSRLIRIEYSTSAHFCDSPTQVVWNRDFKPTPFQATRTATGIILETNDLRLECHDPYHFSLVSGFVLHKEFNAQWHFGEKTTNLKGTARTLDLVSGSTTLSDGVISRDGMAVLDDSESLLLQADGWPKETQGKRTDLYLFAYGHDYSSALKDYYQLSGPLPLIPRYVLGNWWSKYWPYHDHELLEVVRQFKHCRVPLAVMVVDMDWHITEIDGIQDYWQGWTGYTVNKTYFPDFPHFIQTLHEQSLKVSVNLHPSDGLKPYEERYPEFAIAMGLDPNEKQQIPFAPTNPTFMGNYFKLLLHPYEQAGVDLWWVDWQQGTQTAIPGLDPLWLLNHTHFVDSGKDWEKRPLTFSRWTDRGGQRYPIGFSGDSVISWKSLAFQPYFTATAANIGFTLWSHDIGGHDDGIEDPELYCRWVQFGVFSPIMRLHSARNRFAVREPWRHSAKIQTIVSDFLRFRHQLIPYLYTAYQRNHKEGYPALRPLYYHFPEEPCAYLQQNGYMLGDWLYVDPVVFPLDPEINRSRCSTWIPEGTWFDLYTDEPFTGPKTVTRYKPLCEQNVYVKAGAILPLQDDESLSAKNNPDRFLIHVYPGTAGAYTLYEDDGNSQNHLSGDCHRTRFQFQMTNDTLNFSIDPDAQPKPYLPQKRIYRVFFHRLHVLSPEAFCVLKDDGSEITLTGTASEKISLQCQFREIPKNQAILKSLETFLIDLPASPTFKKTVYDAFLNHTKKTTISATFHEARPKARSVLTHFLNRYHTKQTPY